MAGPSSPCNCIPYLNRHYSTSKGGIWVTMPQCQIIPEQVSPVNNPCFEGNKSYWSYNFFIEASDDSLNSAVTSFAIPICKEITLTQIFVLEKLSGAVQYVQRPFELKGSLNKGNEFIMAEEGFQYIIINVDERFSTGLSAEYRLELEGDFPEVLQDIYVSRKMTDGNIFTVGRFIVPGCPPPDELSIIKNCGTNLDKGTALLNYEIIIKNTGGSPARNVQFMDTIGYDGLNLMFGEVKVQSENINPDIISMPSLVEIKGQLGDIAAGTSVMVKYSIPIINIMRNGIFEFTNVATVVNNRGALVQSNCTLQLEASELRTEISKAIQDDNSIIFTVQLAGSSNYPSSNVKFEGELMVDEGLRLEIKKLGSFSAMSEDGIMLNDGYIISAEEGRKKILLSNSDMKLSAGNINSEDIQFKLLSLHKFSESCGVVFSISNLTPLDLKSDIFINIKIPQKSEKILVKGDILNNGELRIED